MWLLPHTGMEVYNAIQFPKSICSVCRCMYVYACVCICMYLYIYIFVEVLSHKSHYQKHAKYIQQNFSGKHVLELEDQRQIIIKG